MTRGFNPDPLAIAVLVFNFFLFFSSIPRRKSYLSSCHLPNKPPRLLIRISITLEAQSLDVRMGGCAVVALVALDLADLDHLERPDCVELVNFLE